MKNIRALTVILFLPLFFATVAKAEEPTVSPLTLAQNAFAFGLYGKLRGSSGNLFFSPYSITTALNMVFVGAKGRTEAEMTKTLRLDAFQAPGALFLRAAVLREVKQRKFFDQTQKGGMTLRVANALWGMKGFVFDAQYITYIKDSFSGSLNSVDFNDEFASRTTINDWVAAQTANKIKNLIGPGVLNSMTRLVLTNAIYFKAAWAKEFEKRATKAAKFHLSSGADVPTDMMNQTNTYGLATLEGFKLLTIPYEGYEASMIILLPDRTDGLASLEMTLTPDKLSEWLEKCQRTNVALSLPKYKSAQSFSLKETLESMGMKTAFSPALADFSAIANTPGEPLFIGAVVHKAFVSVDEEGTEAAPATAVAMQTTAIMQPEKPVPFVADHPFLYIIRADRTGDILFMGRLEDPTQSGE